MKKLLIIALFALGFGLKAQTVAPVSGNTNVQVNPNGSILIGGVLKATITNNTIYDPSNTVIGFILQDGTIQNSSNVTVGQFMPNYDVQNSSNTVIGHLRTNLQVKTAANTVIGNWVESIPPVWSAVAHFFIQI